MQLIELALIPAMFCHPAPYLIHKFYELVCICLLMTKVSHGCGWCFLPAIWAGEAALKFMVDIIIQHYLFYSDWLTGLPYIFGLPGKTSPDRWVGAWLSTN